MSQFSLANSGAMVSEAARAFFQPVGLLAYATAWKTKKNKYDPTFHADTFCPILGPYVILFIIDV